MKYRYSREALVVRLDNLLQEQRELEEEFSDAIGKLESLRERLQFTFDCLDEFSWDVQEESLKEDE